MEELLIVVVIIAAGVVGYFYFKRQMAQQREERDLVAERRRAEGKVKMADPILRADVEALERTGSEYLNDAVALRRRQIEQGRDPGA